MEKKIIQYHGCDLVYKDGTRVLLKNYCKNPTLYPFWKDTSDVTNSVAKSTRAQLENKSIATESEIIAYRKQSKLISNKTFTETKHEANSLTENEVTSSSNLKGDTLIIDENISKRNPESDIADIKQKDTPTTNNKLIPESNVL